MLILQTGIEEIKQIKNDLKEATHHKMHLTSTFLYSKCRKFGLFFTQRLCWQRPADGGGEYSLRGVLIQYKPREMIEDIGTQKPVDPPSVKKPATNMKTKQMNHEKLKEKKKNKTKNQMDAFVRKHAYTLRLSDAYGHLSFSCDDSSHDLCR